MADDWSFKVEAPKEENLKKVSREKKSLSRTRSKTSISSEKERTLKLNDEHIGKEVRGKESRELREKKSLLRDQGFPASLGKRFFAYLIDDLILWGLAGTTFYFTDGVKESFSTIFASVSGLPINIEQIYLIILYLLLYLVLKVYLTSFRGRTIGKYIMGIKVQGSSQGPLGFGQALLRETIGKVLSFALLIGFFLPLFNKRKKSLHDFIAASEVVEK